MNTTQTNGKNCVHHWIIESPNGHFSKGECKFCHAKKEFSNVNDIEGWVRRKKNNITNT